MSLFILVTCISVAFCAMLVMYRLVLSPLASIPGRKIAAATGLYESYYDCWKRGRYWAEIERMHQEYGPVIRISPWEIHVNDPDWNEAYKMSSRPNKYAWYYRFVGTADAAFGTSDHDLHRRRRKAQQIYFSQEHIFDFMPTLSRISSKLCSRLEATRKTGEIINLTNAFKALTADVVTEFAFHESFDLLESEDFAASFHAALRTYSEIGFWHRHFRFVLPLLESIPKWLVNIMNPDGVFVLDFFDNINTTVTSFFQLNLDRKSKVSERSDIITQMLNSPELADNDKTPSRLALEARGLVGAGTETTGHTLSVITFYLLKNPAKLQILKDELSDTRKANRGILEYHDLQRLPYLSSIILESLRISTGVAGRLPRVNPRDALRYKQYVIPKGTPVSTTQKFIHENPTIFPDPKSFIPERWLDPAERKRLEKYLIPFGRGSRSCLGINLAYAEIYITVAKLVEGFDLELFETDKEDILQFHDFFSPYPVSWKGLRVRVV
ncbi:hypothetical protein ACMFMG_006399 [Clarireedia jacksonii]